VKTPHKNPPCIEDYIESRWGRREDGRLIAVKSTLNKELRVLKRIMRTVDETWTLPLVTTVKRVKNKKRKPPLLPEQVVAVGKRFRNRQYCWAFWISVYTGMEGSDITGPGGLTPNMIDLPGGLVLKNRGKSGERILAPITSGFKALLNHISWPMDPDQPFLKDIKPRNYNKAVERAFTVADLAGYTAKDLRRFVASILYDAGVGTDWIRTVLGQARDSDMTHLYTQIYEKKMKTVFERAFKRVGRMGETDDQ